MVRGESFERMLIAQRCAIEAVAVSGEPRLAPGGVGRNQILAEATLGRGGQPGLALRGVELEVGRLPVRL